MAPPKQIGPPQRTIKRPALSDVIPTKPLAPITLRHPPNKNVTTTVVGGTAAVYTRRRVTRENLGAIENHHHHHSQTLITREEKAVSNNRQQERVNKNVSTTSVAVAASNVTRTVAASTTSTTTTSSHHSKRIKVQEEWEDLDKNDVNDPLMVSEYVVEIFEYLHELEKETMPNPNYMEFQKELQWKMRLILVDWLVEIHNKLRLLPETLFLTVNIVDRFLSVRVVSLVKLQLVGITSMFIAAKYEEICGPSIKNFIVLSDGGYSEAEMLKAEQYILQTLDFKLSYPSPMNFLRRDSKADNYEVNARTIAKYLLEIMLLDHRFLATPPSKAAAVALYLARYVIGNIEWHANLVHYSTYTEEQLLPNIELLIDHLKKPRKVEAVYRKYSAKRFIRASVYVQEWINRNYRDTTATTTENYR
ncbi:3046_t:CDS:2 [Ambispora gerdemannii]|uniref:3046_t:CDS:1 n=1 Tax=Ambispora gerdemannii TaxID=144530 RepID=A0A9N8ZQ31_9GLOM|nr:3046_t:CDS:2 [Ambispora gerdemannii]